MKKIFLTLTIIASAFYAQAQTQKGTVYLGGGLVYNNSKIETGVYDAKQTQVLLSPVIGFFLGDNWSLGIAPSYQRINQSVPSYYIDPITGVPVVNYSSAKQSLLGGGVQLRYYWMLLPQFGFYPQLAANYSASVGNDNNDMRTKVISANISPNFVFFPTKKIGVTMGFGALQYAYEKDTNRSNTQYSTTNKSFAIAANQGVSLGINYHFGQ